ncbi:GGDEF domain-containing protein [Streptomyces xiamenensis]|uniref:GGDEF domain-containing protein n=1 Tax=Streptomyces xiamenensis TaxID=408015 RepID=UPI0035DC5A93
MLYTHCAPLLLLPLLLLLLIDRHRLLQQRNAARRNLNEAQHTLDSARRDPLTGLANRALFLPAAQKLLDQHGDDTLILFLDGNGLKSVNDTSGHAAGDAFITAIAHRLEEWVGDGGTVARLGGDEFAAAVRLPTAEHQSALNQLATTINRPMTLNGTDIPVSVAIGAASPVTTGLSRIAGRPGLLRAADGAMYRAKHSRAPYALGTHTDAAADTLTGRRPGRAGTQLASLAA